MDDHQMMREKVAREYGITLYLRYCEKEASSLVGYEASWWKRHRKAGNIPFIQDAGGGISYFGYMLCDLLILGKDAMRLYRTDNGAPTALPTAPTTPRENAGGAALAMKIIEGT